MFLRCFPLHVRTCPYMSVHVRTMPVRCPYDARTMPVHVRVMSIVGLAQRPRPLGAVVLEAAVVALVTASDRSGQGALGSGVRLHLNVM